MREKTYRTVAATVVLLGLAVIALTRVGATGASSLTLEEEREEATTTATGETTTTLPEPFDYRVGLLADISTANFWAYVGEEPTVWTSYVLGPTKPSLYGLDPETHGLVPDLATGEPAAPVEDGEAWVVTVDLAGLAWSDGTPITAHDLAYTFETVRRLGLEGGWAEAFPPQVASVVAETPTRARIVFTEEPGLAVWPYGVGLAPIMPAHVWGPLSEKVADPAALYALAADGDVSGGPIRIVTVETDRIEAEANPQREVGIDRLTYLVFATEDDAVAALEAGEIDVILNPHGLSPAAVQRLATTPEVELVKSPANSVRYLGFNLEREPMTRPAFRTALALLLDRETAAETLVPGALPAYTLLTPANPAWFDPEAAEAIAAPYRAPLEMRLERALAALGEAGYAWETAPALVDGVLTPGAGLTIDGRAPTPLTILTPGDAYDPARPDYAARIEATLEILGFEVDPVVTDFDTVVDLAFTPGGDGARRYDMYLLGWTLGNPALPDYHRALFTAAGVANSTGYASVELEEALTAYEAAGDLEEARARLWDMERRLATDLPYLVLYHPQLVEAYRSDRVGFGLSAALGGIQGRMVGIGDVAVGGEGGD